MQLNKCVIGIELGSTRIKSVLLDENNIPAASGSYDWENKLINGIWTYSLDEVTVGIRTCFAELKANVKSKLGVELTTVGAMGISGMMHGYLPFNKNGKLLAPFRTWRNTITGEAAEELSKEFGFNVPQRWSIAHLYQAILNGEEHIKDIARITTLAGFIHEKLTGETSMGIGEASGMFPIDSQKLDYDEKMLCTFNKLIKEKGVNLNIKDILPTVLTAGQYAGSLTKEGALFLDPTGTLQPGIAFAPCEGDAGTGMTATNSVRVYTGNVSAGTSDFAMIVTDRKLGVHREIDMVTTPAGAPVAMVHCNNCTSDINAWASLFGEFAEAIGASMAKGKILDLMFFKALEGAPDCGGLMSYNYFSGEGVTDFDEGRPVFARTENCSFTLANFMRTHILSSLATLKIGLDILIAAENVRIDKLYGHGGFFKAAGVGQRLLSAAVNAPVSVMETAGEGGPYGMALLASYMLNKSNDETLADYLDNRIFSTAKSTEVMAEKSDIDGFSVFLERYKKALEIERVAVKTL